MFIPKYRQKVQNYKVDTKVTYGWGTIRWAFGELVKMYSTQPSYFSKKRVESGLAFIIGQLGMIFYLISTYHKMSTSDFMMWASLEFVIAGYITERIQNQKKAYLKYEQTIELQTGDDESEMPDDDYQQGDPNNKRYKSKQVSEPI